ncbi:MAG: WD40/YVTN/BNR-like repeat-containing protein [Chitinophagaceae bacterium]
MKSILLLIVSIFSLTAFSQKNIFDLFKNLKPRNIGPAGMSGRVTTIDAVNSNTDIIYVGAASGGVWKTENGGTTWASIFDDQPILNIGSLAIQQSNPSVVWVGTGEGNPRNSISLGGGIYKSLDAGKTWKLMGLEKTKCIHRVIIDPTNPNIVYAGAIGNPYAEHPERGVYKTTDGGETWNKVLYTNDTSGTADLVMDPSNPNKLLAGMWQHRRTPWSFKSGGKGSGLYMTLDGGKTWKKSGKEEGIPGGDLGRIGLAFSASQPSRVYAMIEATKNGLYKSDDGGFKWELVNSDPAYVTTRSFYFNDIIVDPQNENRLYSLYQPIAVSEDGGKSFKVNAPTEKIHADHHAMWINPKDPSFIIDGGDGGLSISHDKGKTWKFEEQLIFGQFYHINVDNELPYHVMGGLQDNGSWWGPAYQWVDGPIRNFAWQDVGSGDGFDVAPDPEDANWVYAMSQGGELAKYNISTGERARIKPPAPDLQTRLRFNWNAGLAVDPLDAKTIYYGSQFLHKSTNKGLTWEIISPDLTTNNKEQQKQDENGGLSIDITGAENFTTILTIAPSSKQKGIIWVGTDDGNVQLTKDGGKSWTNFRGKISGLPTGAWIHQVKASRYNAAEAFVVANDYRRGDFKPYIFRTKDFGNTWTRILNGSNVKGYALCVLQDPTEPNLIFAGTEQGLWISFDNGNSFQQFKNDYPSISTYDLAIQEREADLAIATFGRSLYILDDIRPLRKIAALKGQFPSKQLTAFEAPPSYMVRYKNAEGYNSSPWGMFEGSNRNKGAAYSFFVKPSLKTDTNLVAKKPALIIDTTQKRMPTSGGEDLTDMQVDSSKARIGLRAPGDSATVKIYNENNELIRTLRVRADTGVNRNYWGFEMKGVKQVIDPSQTSGRGGGRFGGAGTRGAEPPGQPVFPGTYKMVISLRGTSDSTMIVVKGDPNVPMSRELYDARMKVLKRLEMSTAKLVAVTEQLTDAEETIKKVEASLAGVEGKPADALKRMNKAMTDSIKNIRDYIFGKKQEKQGYGTPYQVTVNGRLQEANFGIAGKNKFPDAQEIRLTEEAEFLVNDVVRRANNFFSTKWKEYQTAVETSQIKLFKEVKMIE